MKIKMFHWMDYREAASFGSGVRILAFLLFVSLTVLVIPANSSAKDWPTKSITIIVPWPVGAATDMAPRIMAPKMAKILGVPIQVVNKPGGSGIIGTNEAVKSPPDGYTIFSDMGGTSSNAYALVKELPFKVAERTYIARTVFCHLGMLVPASSPWKTIADFVNDIQTKPTITRWSLVGGTGPVDVVNFQLQASLLAKGVDQTKIRIVAYKGTGETIVALAGGHVDVGFGGPPSSQALVSAGKVRPLFVTGKERYKGWPNIPTSAEAGFPSVDHVFWAGLSGPPGMPSNIVKILENAARETISDPEVIAKLDAAGVEPFYLPGDLYRKFVLEEGEAIKSLKLK